MNESIKVLIVEDDPVTRSLMTRILNLIDYDDVTPVGSAEEAFIQLRSRA